MSVMRKLVHERGGHDKLRDFRRPKQTIHRNDGDGRVAAVETDAPELPLGALAELNAHYVILRHVGKVPIPGVIEELLQPEFVALLHLRDFGRLRRFRHLALPTGVRLLPPYRSSGWPRT